MNMDVQRLVEETIELTGAEAPALLADDSPALAKPQSGKAEGIPKMVRHALDAMANGGIRDHLGGGFHRYSTDGQWLVPHFEIMLYDNAMLAWSSPMFVEYR